MTTAADGRTITLARRTFVTGLLGAVAAAPLAGPARAQAAARPEAGALYRDPSQPVAARVEDLLRRMTLEEKTAQMVGIWEKKGDIQTASGDFAADKASRVFPHGLGQISRPSDFRGVDPSQNGAAGASGEAVNRDARQTADIRTSLSSLKKYTKTSYL